MYFFYDFFMYFIIYVFYVFYLYSNLYKPLNTLAILSELLPFTQGSTIAGKINVTQKSVRLSEKLQLTAAVLNEIGPQ